MLFLGTLNFGSVQNRRTSPLSEHSLFSRFSFRGANNSDTGFEDITFGDADSSSQSSSVIRLKAVIRNLTPPP